MDIPRATYTTSVLHNQGQPIPIIFDENKLNIPRYHAFVEDALETSVGATEYFGKESNGEIVPRGIVITLKLKTPDDFMEFIIIPDDEFITELIACKKLYFGNSNGIAFFQMDLDTKTIENVWQPSKHEN
ncbi:MAG: hypothetical protein AABX32_08275 [Nanoarchaeota archaeon]